MNGPFSSDEPDDPSQRKAPAMAVLVVLLLTGAVLVAVLPKKVDEVITLRISCTSGAISGASRIAVPSNCLRAPRSFATFSKRSIAEATSRSLSSRS